MFLEETIEAMEMMEDSGISNDEPDFGPKLEDNNQPTVNGTLLTSKTILYHFFDSLGSLECAY